MVISINIAGANYINCLYYFLLKTRIYSSIVKQKFKRKKSKSVDRKIPIHF